MNRIELNHSSELTPYPIPEPIHRLLLAFLFTCVLYFNVGSSFPSKPALVNGGTKATATYSQPRAKSFPAAQDGATLEKSAPLQVARNAAK